MGGWNKGVCGDGAWILLHQGRETDPEGKKTPCALFICKPFGPWRWPRHLKALPGKPRQLHRSKPASPEACQGEACRGKTCHKQINHPWRSCERNFGNQDQTGKGKKRELQAIFSLKQAWNCKQWNTPENFRRTRCKKSRPNPPWLGPTHSQGPWSLFISYPGKYEGLWRAV